jgi:multidrug efflux pump subunit AcrB
MTLWRRLIIVAAVILFIAIEVGLLGWIGLSAWRPAKPPLPVITVEASYPGASAAVVADTVASPIEQQVNGVEGMVCMTSQCDNDGTYRLRVTFERNMDMNMALVLVQNRASLAMPVVPSAVQQTGIAVRKGSGPPMLYVVLSSPDSRYDEIYLSNYARSYVKDELARVAGVSEVTTAGVREFALRLLLDPQKLAAHQLSPLDITSALEHQNVSVAAFPSKDGVRDMVLRINLHGRLTDPDQLADTILKADAGAPVRLRDVARVELDGSGQQDQAILDGKSVVAVGVCLLPSARPAEVAASVRARLDLLREHLPEGLELAITCDCSDELGRSATSRFLAIDVDLPVLASRERTAKVLLQCDRLLRETAGVKHVLALSAPPLDANQGCIVVELDAEGLRTPGRDKVIASVRTRLTNEVQEARIRLRLPALRGRAPLAPYPIDLALLDDQDDRAKLREFATKLVERSSEGDKLTDVWSSHSDEEQPSLFIDVDRERAADLGVALHDVMQTLQALTALGRADDVEAVFGKMRVGVRAGADLNHADVAIRQLKVRNASGDMVPLSAFVSVRETMAPRSVRRMDLYPMIEITANPAEGVSLADARKHCETVADEVRAELGLRNPATGEAKRRSFRLQWLPD